MMATAEVRDMLLLDINSWSCHEMYLLHKSIVTFFYYVLHYLYECTACVQINRSFLLDNLLFDSFFVKKISMFQNKELYRDEIKKDA